MSPCMYVCTYVDRYVCMYVSTFGPSSDSTLYQVGLNIYIYKHQNVCIYTYTHGGCLKLLVPANAAKICSEAALNWTRKFQNPTSCFQLSCLGTADSTRPVCGTRHRLCLYLGIQSPPDQTKSRSGSSEWLIFQTTRNGDPQNVLLSGIEGTTPMNHPV